MPLAWLFVDDSPVTTDLDGLTPVALLGCHEFDAAWRCRWLFQSINDDTHWQATSCLVNRLLG